MVSKTREKKGSKDKTEKSTADNSQKGEETTPSLAQNKVAPELQSKKKKTPSLEPPPGILKVTRSATETESTLNTTTDHTTDFTSTGVSASDTDASKKFGKKKPSDPPNPAVSKKKTSDPPNPAVTKKKTSDPPDPTASKKKPSDPPDPAVTKKKTSDPPDPAASKKKPSDPPNPADTDVAQNSKPEKKKKSHKAKSKAKKKQQKSPPEPEKKVKSITLRTSSAAFRGLIKQQGSNLSSVFRVDSVNVKHDSTSTSSSSTDTGFFHVVEALRCLNDVQQVYMQRLLDYQDVEASGVTFREDNPRDLAYQIVSQDGETLFLMEQHKILCSSFIVFSRRSFLNTFYDRSGNKILKVVGPAVFLSKVVSKIKITDGHGRILGYIKAFGTKVNYSVYNARGDRLFLVTSTRFLPTSKTVFTIIAHGEAIGHIRNAWNVVQPEITFIDSHDPGVSFPSMMDDREKSLLIGCMTIIEYSWYSPVTKLRLFFILVVCCLSIFTMILAAIPMMVDTSKEDPTTRSYYEVEKPDIN